MGVSGDEPEPRSTSVNLEARLEATATIGPPGYHTTITATCVSRGLSGGIQQFWVRSSTDDSVNQAFTRPEADSLTVTIDLDVVHRHTIDMRCAVNSGDVSEKRIRLDGYQPEIHTDAFPEVALVEGVPTQIHFSRGLFPYAEELRFVSRDGLSVDLNNWESSPVMTLHAASGGVKKVQIQALNGFGDANVTVEWPARDVTDFVYQFKESGSFAYVFGIAEWIDSRGRQLALRGLPPIEGSIQPTEEPGTITMKFGHQAGKYFPFSKTFDTTNGQDVNIRVSVLEREPCEATFSSRPDPLKTCQDLVRELLFTDVSGRQGYRPFPRPRAVTVLMTNPETGVRLDDAWLGVLTRLRNRLVTLGMSLYVLEPDLEDEYARQPDGALVYSDQVWMYPRTASESLFTPWIVDQEGIIKGATMAIDPDTPPIDEDLLFSDALALLMGLDTGPMWEQLPANERLAFMTEVVSKFRFDDLTPWAIQPGELVDHVMALPE